MDVLEKTENIVNDLNDVLKHIENLPKELSQVDSAICDLRHWIEHNTINTKGCYRIIQEFKKLTLERRRIMNDMEVGRTLTTHIHKLSNARDFLLHEVRKTNARLNQPYKNRIYTDDQMEYLLGRSDSYEVMECKND